MMVLQTNIMGSTELVDLKNRKYISLVFCYCPDKYGSLSVVLLA